MIVVYELKGMAIILRLSASLIWHTLVNNVSSSQ